MKKSILFAIIKNKVHIGNVSSISPKSALLNYLQSAKLTNIDTEFLKKYKAIRAIRNIHYYF